MGQTSGKGQIVIDMNREQTQEPMLYAQSPDLQSRYLQRLSLKLRFTLALICLIVPLTPVSSFAATAEAEKSSSQRLHLPSGVLLAQADESYDPFADYSEFEESVEEEEDLNFFRNGRLLTLGFIGGMRGWTQNLGQLYSANIGFGLFISYFFDLRFALQFGFLTSDHTLTVNGTTFTPFRGTVNITDLGFNLKYYFNTQNVTRGLADLNPYIVAGFSQIYRSTTVSGAATTNNSIKDSAFGFNAGAGIEVPLMRNKMFFGVQGTFQYVMFTDESKVILDENDQKTGLTLAGDSFTGLAVLGVNF